MGSPKAWLPFGDERLLQRVVRLAGTVAHAIVVVAAPGQDLPELPPDVTVVRDAVAARGPLQGLAGGFAALPRSVDALNLSETRRKPACPTARIDARRFQRRMRPMH